MSNSKDKIAQIQNNNQIQEEHGAPVMGVVGGLLLILMLWTFLADGGIVDQRNTNVPQNDYAQTQNVDRYNNSNQDWTYNDDRRY